MYKLLELASFHVSCDLDFYAKIDNESACFAWRACDDFTSLEDEPFTRCFSEF